MTSYLILARLLSRHTLALALAIGTVVPAQAVTIDWASVGNPGNASDPASGNAWGAVSYEYRIAKYEVTIGQYVEFLNAVAATDTYSLYNPNMATNPNSAGIARSGTDGNFNYAPINNAGNSANRPVTYVSWFDAARFANWLENGQPTGAQGPGTTETGAYTLAGATIGPVPGKNPGATHYIPTLNEWYKAAYYSPVLNSGTGGYYAFATQSNSAPGNVVGSGANRANYFNGVWSVTQSATYSASLNYLTDVGASTNSASFYGTFDQSGSVYEWNDLSGEAASLRGLRGGAWDTDAAPLQASHPGFAATGAHAEQPFSGFRLASPVPVPEPSAYAMALAGVACGGYTLSRRRRTR
jgi:formylglycine-generating enzyme required for sulfatase activity